MSQIIYPLEIYPYISIISPNLTYIVKNTYISVKQYQSDIDATYYSNMPNLHKYVVDEKKIKKTICYEITISKLNGKTLVVKNVDVKYLRIFSKYEHFRNILTEVFYQLTFDHADDFLADFLDDSDITHDIKIIDFTDFIQHIEYQLQCHEDIDQIQLTNTHKIYVQINAILLEATDCLNHIFSYIDFPNLCKMRLVSTKFLHIIEGYTLPPKAIETINMLKLEFSYGCFYNSNKKNIDEKYDTFANKFIIDKRMDNYMISVMNEYIVFKCMTLWGFSLANKLISKMHIQYTIDQEKIGDIDNNMNFNNKLKLSREQFIWVTFRNMPIIINFLQNKQIHDLYSLINLSIIKKNESYRDTVGKHILCVYGHQQFLDTYLRNCWKYFPDLNFKAYNRYKDLIAYLNSMLSNGIHIPFTVKNYFLDIITDNDINNCSSYIAKSIVDDAIYNDNVDVFSKIFENKKIKKSRKTYIKYAKGLKHNCHKILDYLQNIK